MDDTKPQPEKRSRRRRTPDDYVEFPNFPEHDVIPTGKQVAQLLDDAGIDLTEDERARLLAIKDPPAMKEFLNSYIGSMEQREAKTQFSRFLQRIELPAVLMTLHFDNLRAAQRAIDFAEDALKTPNLTAQNKSDLIRGHLLAVHEKGVLIRNAMTLVAQLLEKSTRPRRPVAPKVTQKPEKPAPKNLPPDTLAPRPQLSKRTESGANTATPTP